MASVCMYVCAFLLSHSTYRLKRETHSFNCRIDAACSSVSERAKSRRSIATE